MVSSFEYLFLPIYTNHKNLANVQFLTMWGATLTWMVQLLACVLHFCPQVKKVYHPFALWKWYVFLYTLTFLMEIIITAVFWTLLWNDAKDQPMFEKPLDRVGLIMDHSVPFSVLLFDYLFLNTVPFVMRHLPAQVFIVVIYLILNISVSFV